MSAKKDDSCKPPVVQGFMHYFPRAIKAVSLASKVGTEKYKLEYADKNFMGLDPNRLVDADGRHILDEAIDGMYDPESGLLHAAHHAWEAMARLEVILEGGQPVKSVPILTATEIKELRGAHDNPPPAEKGVGAASRYRAPVATKEDIDRWKASVVFQNTAWNGSLMSNHQPDLVCDSCIKPLAVHIDGQCPPPEDSDNRPA